MGMRFPDHLPGKKSSVESGHFRSTDHLSTEAVAAYVDGELSDTAAHRARVHVVACDECRREVVAQRQAADRLRSSRADSSLRAPGSLVERLNRVQDMCADNANASSTGAQSRGAEIMGEVVDAVGATLRSITRRR
ncbi:anti-sigma factor family protein [Corynebacterium sp.]|uniref:anti-sigma factor family protein n=1 Tax=Corynebacterium sp. TaxID=1720 RepID=UPI002A91B249|nr:zf-HC2 domain-containing protein [Corynebacterium sp.]MDY5784791.1 zf-HC2 domain-containing protein [Corynebacterium sp.]